MCRTKLEPDEMHKTSSAQMQKPRECERHIEDLYVHLLSDSATVRQDGAVVKDIGSVVKCGFRPQLGNPLFLSRNFQAPVTDSCCEPASSQFFGVLLPLVTKGENNQNRCH